MKMKARLEKHAKWKEWPILGVSNLQDTVKYYTEKLSFELFNDRYSIKTRTEVKLRLFDFVLVLKEGAKGPIYDPQEYADEIIPNGSPILWIPVPEPKSYFDILKSKGANVVSKKNDYLDYELEGFFVLDNEDNKLFFFLDHHGPYDPFDWVLQWINENEEWPQFS